MNSAQKGFNLIELMIVVAVIGLLAAIAVPAYQDYSIRSKVSEALGMASSLKTAVIEQAANGGLANVKTDTAGDSASVSRYVRALAVEEAGMILVATQNTGATVDPELRLVPSENGGGIVWRCLKTPATLASQVPPMCRDDVAGGYRTSTDPKDIKDTVAEIFRALKDFTKKWTANGGMFKPDNVGNASFSWSNNTAFMDAFFEFAGLTDFNRSGYAPISDFKVFYKRDANGKITSEVSGVYLQIGGKRHILFSNGDAASGEHYGDFLAGDPKQLTPP
ncbi:pilin [Thiocapsa bogorovii]|uniref:pilin n=1 Tax=Thiocapsa bogorovii TaxID=521689 RepID=UPI0022B6D7A8|nr:pilin [Thiocapsa bogorovii]